MSVIASTLPPGDPRPPTDKTPSVAAVLVSRGHRHFEIERAERGTTGREFERGVSWRVPRRTSLFREGMTASRLQKRRAPTGHDSVDARVGEENAKRV